MEVGFMQSRIKGFSRLDIKIFIPFFTRRFTQQVSKFFHIESGNFEKVAMFCLLG